MYLSLHSVICDVDDLQRAKEWYGQVLDAEPVIDRPSFASFRIVQATAGGAQIEQGKAPRKRHPPHHWPGRRCEDRRAILHMGGLPCLPICYEIDASPENHRNLGVSHLTEAD